MATPTQEQLEIQALARDFASGELRPHSARWDHDRAIDDDVFEKLAEVGFLGMTVPEAHGGLDFDPVTYLMVLEELSWGDASVALAVAIHSGPVTSLLLRHGNSEQQDTWLPRMAAGEILGAFALSEEAAGTDAGSVATLAERDGDGWRIRGEKKWVTNGARAGLVVVFARTGDDALSAFLVSPDDAGYEVVGGETTMGLRGSQTVTVRLDLKVESDALLGVEGKGLAYALEALDVGRIGIAAQAVGIGRAAMEHAAAYALEREQFNRPIAKFGAIQVKLAEMARRISAGRLLAHDAGALLGQTDSAPRTGVDGLTARAAIAKLDASEAASWAADEAVQIYGGYGYMRHYPVEKLLRDAKGTEIYEGTNEILRHVIAREVLRDAEER